MQVRTFSAHMVLGSELVDFFGDGTSVLYGPWLIDFSPRTNDRLRYSANTGSILQELHITERLTLFKSSDDERTNSPNSPSVAIVCPQVEKIFFIFVQKILSGFFGNA